MTTLHDIERPDALEAATHDWVAATSGVHPTGSGRPALRAAARWSGRLLLVAAWIMVAAMAVVTWGPHLTPYRTDVIIGRSMEPTVPLWSVIFARPVNPSDIRTGDVITYQRPDAADMKVTHRVVDVVDDEHGRGFVTRGDANPIRDPYVVRYDGTGWRVEGHAPHLGWFILQAQRREARVVLVVLPTLILLAQFLLWLWRPPRTLRDETQPFDEWHDDWHDVTDIDDHGTDRESLAA